ncbi:MAG: hypothetical protein JEZ07_09860 [Phycisphaerae bacterium]|nr:hypothetical protein [Phycisphaerae bacterium]
MKKTIIIILMSIMAIVSSGCVKARIYDFTAISTKPIKCENVDLTKLDKVEVSARKVFFLGWFFNYEDATDRAISKANGNLMLDAVVYQVYGYPFCSCVEVKGSVVKVPIN